MKSSLHCCLPIWSIFSPSARNMER